MKDIWVIAEHLAGKIEDVTLEMIGEGRRLAQKLGKQICVVLIGYQKVPPLQLLSSHGVDRLYIVDDPVLTDYTTDAYASALVSLIREKFPSIVLFGATANGSDLASAVSARMRVALISGCTALKINDEGVLEATRPVYEDKVYGTVVFQATTFPRMATIRPGAIGIDKVALVRRTQVEEVRPHITAKDTRTNVVGYTQADARTLDIAEAEIIVAGGHGVGTRSNWHLVEELADVLTGAVGGSRIAMDNGWITREHLVGQSGKSVKPALYVVLGISGASQHTQGMKESERVIAINKDKGAAIFKLANLSIVADLTEVLPPLIAKLRELRKREDVPS